MTCARRPRRMDLSARALRRSGLHRLSGASLDPRGYSAKARYITVRVFPFWSLVFFGLMLDHCRSPYILLPRRCPLPRRCMDLDPEVSSQLASLPQVSVVDPTPRTQTLNMFSPPTTSFPVIFSGTGAIPPASAVNYVPWAIVGFIFQYFIRRRHFSWWTKYNCESSVLVFS